MEDWKSIIVTLVYIRQKMRKVDKDNLWEYYLPEVATTKEDIDQVQQKLHICLSDEYQNFLLYANGWSCFYQMVDLFGTKDFISDKMERALEMLSIVLEYNEELYEMKKNLFPIAISRIDIDLFVMVTKKGEMFGEVIWFAGGEIERYKSFTEFFMAMIEYNKLDAEDLEKEWEDD